jgi:hypothetical protein
MRRPRSRRLRVEVSAGDAVVADGDANASGAGAEWLKRTK